MGGKRIRIDTNLQLKKCAKRYLSSDDDRISQLPDEILVDILSLLSLKEAARTAVLSSRWINLRKHTPSLNFDADERVLGKFHNQRELLKREKRKYVKWVNSVVQSHESVTLKEFKVRFPLNRSSRNSITRWLEFALSRRVQRLELDLENNYDSSKDYCFPNELLTISSCRASKLQPPSDGICIDHPRMLVDFKCLKALSFRAVGVSDEDIGFFLDNCPLLEQLIVQESEKISKLEICGSSLKLKHLEIVRCVDLESLKVSLPRLTTLAVTSSEGLLLENVPMLVNVSVICYETGISVRQVFDVLSCYISRLQTLYLELTRRLFMPESDELYELPKMPKLKKLSIEYHARGDESLIKLAAWIRVSPYLEEFVLEFKWYKLPREDREVTDALIRSPHHHLKVFKFRGYYGRTNDAELLGYILENCVVLEKMIIRPYFLGDGRLEVEETGRKNAEQKLAPQVPQHVELVIL